MAEKSQSDRLPPFPCREARSVTIAGTEEEVVELGVLHTTTVHGHQNTAKLREQIRSMLQVENATARARAPNTNPSGKRPQMGGSFFFAKGRSCMNKQLQVMCRICIQRATGSVKTISAPPRENKIRRWANHGRPT